ncbi:unnamed protein product [Caenorhabditis auriculariae]|uniref:CRIB domain-containing protein n=1 Tax=Caenorhabditis auriculariae TaxID=2777116 RepID=A0A8S1HBL9_9PELO|nr:unnamed protein product [Caenorhabditis auriculariae]
MCSVNESPTVVMLRDVLAEEDVIETPNNAMVLGAGSRRTKPRRKFTVRVPGKDEKTGDRRSALQISGPSDFMHIVHMGPAPVVELQQNFIDLQPPQPQSTAEKVRNLIPIGRSQSSSSAALNSVRGGASSTTRSSDLEHLSRTRPLSTTSKSSDGMRLTPSTSASSSRSSSQTLSPQNRSAGDPRRTPPPPYSAPYFTSTQRDPSIFVFVGEERGVDVPIPVHRVGSQRQIEDSGGIRLTDLTSTSQASNSPPQWRHYRNARSEDATQVNRDRSASQLSTASSVTLTGGSSSLGRDGNMTTASSASENHYLEPVSRSGLNVPPHSPAPSPSSS